MPVFDQGDGADAEILTEALLETEAEFEEAITIRRFVSQSTTSSEFGQAPAPVYTDFPATAVLANLGVGARAFEAEVLSAGDVVLQTRERLREADEAQGGTNPGDRVVYRGAEYRLVQRPIPVHLSEEVFYDNHLRRINPSTDVGGL